MKYMLIYPRIQQVRASFLDFNWRLVGGVPMYRKWEMVLAKLPAVSYVGCWIASAMACHPASLFFTIGIEVSWGGGKR